jgi:hypothetical protein
MDSFQIFFRCPSYGPSIWSGVGIGCWRFLWIESAGMLSDEEPQENKSGWMILVFIDCLLLVHISEMRLRRLPMCAAMELRPSFPKMVRYVSGDRVRRPYGFFYTCLLSDHIFQLVVVLDSGVPEKINSTWPGAEWLMEWYIFLGFCAIFLWLSSVVVFRHFQILVVEAFL